MTDGNYLDVTILKLQDASLSVRIRFSQQNVVKAELTFTLTEAERFTGQLTELLSEVRRDVNVAAAAQLVELLDREMKT